MRPPTVAIIGRPNVGKSSLFNRFIRRRLAVVDAVSGVTRDRNYAMCDWNGVTFRLIDTGGMVPRAEDQMNRLIYQQAEFAIDEADLILFVVDCHVGTDDTDREIARRLAKSGRPYVLVANKTDSDDLENQMYEFLTLGLGEPVPVSATGGRGTGDLLDRLVASLPKQPDEVADDDDSIRIAVVGRPNVGKSSFINQLIGQERLIVTPIAGTTRDAVDTEFEFEDQKYIMVDTAGLRKKHRVHEDIEFYTSLRTQRAVDGCDVAIVIVDATDCLHAQDQRILDDVFSMRRPALLAVNKWDLVEKDSKTADEFTVRISDTLAKYSHLPMVYISALSGQRVAKVLSFAKELHALNRKRIPTAELNEFLEAAVARNHPPARKGKHIKLNYMTQTEISPPSFVVFSNKPTLIDKSYISYLENQIRSKYGFDGVPFRLKFRRK